ncbi:MAG: hypothetical protein SOU08_08225 [Anaerococcus sp.]|nr:hypothetical protein [Anaerococcus sp.]MDD7045372.1 hypothetical protein [Peptoniphilaceae bacterium]MDY2919602.1 hypothetical protein [Anaerococcus sp.]
MLIISNKAKDEFRKFLAKENIEFIETIDNPNLYEPIGDHPDLSIFPLGDGKILVDKVLAPYYREKLPTYEIIEGDSVKVKYPYDSIYNVYEGDDFFIHNDLTESHILAHMEDKTHLRVNQGYTRCSIIPMGDRILTGDYGIYKKLRDEIKIILLPREDIDLPGFETGFIGGTCGLYGDRLIFDGDIERLKSFEIIKENADEAGLTLVYPKDLDLKDLGSLMAV